MGMEAMESRGAHAPDADIARYRAQYMQSAPVSDRVQVGVDRRLAESFRDVLHWLGEGCSLAGYLDGILRDHLQRHDALLTREINRVQRSRKSLLPDG